MKKVSKEKLETSAIITLVLGIFSAIALLFTFLALCDIANHEPDQTLEWYMVGVGLMIWVAFIVSTLVTIRFLFGHLEEQSKLN
ncbi:MAG: hypothetical protein Q8R96_13670 [Bacteroidota bacterium]|nr:hypothetical protein [Bacteroidota bacterium]